MSTNDQSVFESHLSFVDKQPIYSFSKKEETNMRKFSYEINGKPKESLPNSHNFQKNYLNNLEKSKVFSHLDKCYLLN